MIALAVRSSYFWAVGLIFGTGCTEPVEPMAPPAGANVGVQVPHAASFYYYEGERLGLQVDPDRLVIKWSEPHAIDVAGLVLERSLGTSIQTRAAIETRPGHEIITLTRGASAAALAALGNGIRDVDGVEFASLVYRTVDDGHDFVPLGRVMVEFVSGTTDVQIDEINQLFGTRTVRSANPDSAWFFHILELPKSLNREPMDLVAELYEHRLIEWADIDKITERLQQTIPTDPLYRAHQYYLFNTVRRNGIRVDINVEPAWQVTKGEGIPSAGGIRVAVIDDGVDASHPDLNVSTLGYDLFDRSKTLGCSDCQFSPFENDTHGTAVAGIIGAQHDGIGTAGIAPAVHIMPIRIFRRTYPPSLPWQAQYAGDIEAAEAIDFAWSLASAHVINNSWGGGAPSDAITSAIARAVNSGRGGLGSVVVFGAGNTSNRSAGQIGAVQYPANRAILYTIFSVGAVNRSGDPTNYTPRAHSLLTGQLTIVAPSGHTTGSCIGDVVTTELRGNRGCQDGPSGNANYTSTFSGTSAAAPQVAGAAALLLSKYPNLTAEEVRTRIRNTADSWGSSRDFGAGKLNIGRLLPPPPPPPPPPEPCEPVPPEIICSVP